MLKLDVLVHGAILLVFTKPCFLYFIFFNTDNEYFMVKMTHVNF